MGNQISHTDNLKLLKNCDYYFQKKSWNKLDQASYNQFSIISQEDKDRMKYTHILKQMFEKPKLIDPQKLDFDHKMSRKVACLLGLAVCDALGASTQFIPFKKDRKIFIEDFHDIREQIQKQVLKPRHGMTDVWTDDCSMALCIADSLLLNNFQFNPKHLRYMFHMWLYHGLNNGGRQVSIGLGGNIKISMDQFTEQRNEYTAEKDRYNNGNGSLMRLAPVPICFSDDLEKAILFSAQQSLTTHNGDQAKQCAKLMTSIVVKLINRPPQKEHYWKEVIEQACQSFHTKYQTVRNLALSKEQPRWLYEWQLDKYKQKFYKFNRIIKDRNWNWKDPNFTYSQCRFNDQPGYIGSYCMDALAMALHTVWYRKSFKEIAVWNANMGGDCDTVGAIAGQIAGAIYGLDKQILYLYSQMRDARKLKFQVFLKAYKLAAHRKL